MFAPDKNNNNGFLDNINKLAETGLNQIPQGNRLPSLMLPPQQFPSFWGNRRFI